MKEAEMKETLVLILLSTKQEQSIFSESTRGKIRSSKRGCDSGRKWRREVFIVETSLRFTVDDTEGRIITSFFFLGGGCFDVAVS